MHSPFARHPISWLACIVAGATLVAAGNGPRHALDIDTAVHVANRLTFGATAETVQQLRSDGLDGWLIRQMRPERIPDAALDARLATLATISLTPRQLAEMYYLPALERRKALQARMQTGLPPAGPEPGPPSQAPESMTRRDTAERSPRQVQVDLTTQKLVRATSAERQLEEVLVDFWFNHFNVFADKGPVRQYVYDFERTAIRPHVLGSFREMLGAVAGHPAMLFYLDNWQSSAPGSHSVRGATGLNENYARELLELHTLGVDGGYTQADIVNVARAFTGWTIRGPRQGGDAFFDPRRHDAGAKTVLGQRIAAGGGREDGQRVLELVARHPATARHLARKLAIRFVADTPPEPLVSRVASRFTQTGGDLRATIEALVTSPEFIARQARLAKVKTPLEFVTSAVRVLDVDIDGAKSLGQELRTLGMAPYLAQPPTGYSDRADAWTNGGALVQRMNIAVALTSGRMGGVAAPVLPTVDGDTAEARARAMARALLLRDASPATIRTVAQAKTPRDMAALILE